jgi:DNA-binding XRE family transcriptional regulator
MTSIDSGAPRDVELDGRRYVLVPKAEFERLLQEADRPRADAASFVNDPLGPELRARRRRAGLTLAQVAQRAGIAAETLSRIENGRSDPSLGTLRCVLRALEVPA